VVALSAKRSTDLITGSSPAHKARRRSHPRTSPKIADGKAIDSLEFLEPQETQENTLEQRLRFVSPAGDKNGSNSEAYLSGLVRQIKKLGIAQEQDAIELNQETKAMLRNDIDSTGTPEKTRGRGGLWRMCVEPGSEKDIHTTEEDGWQIVEEYGEKTPPRHSPSPSPERTSDATSSLILAPSRSNPVLSRSDTREHFQWLVENLPYPESMYSVSVDDAKQQIVIQTSNRKYYKRIDVPELIDRGLELNRKLLMWKHCQDTLTVSYARPTGA